MELFRCRSLQPDVGSFLRRMRQLTTGLLCCSERSIGPNRIDWLLVLRVVARVCCLISAVLQFSNQSWHLAKGRQSLWKPCYRRPPSTWRFQFGHAVRRIVVPAQFEFPNVGKWDSLRFFLSFHQQFVAIEPDIADRIGKTKLKGGEQQTEERRKRNRETNESARDQWNENQRGEEKEFPLWRSLKHPPHSLLKRLCCDRRRGADFVHCCVVPLRWGEVNSMRSRYGLPLYTLRARRGFVVVM